MTHSYEIFIRLYYEPLSARDCENNFNKIKNYFVKIAPNEVIFKGKYWKIESYYEVVISKRLLTFEDCLSACKKAFPFYSEWERVQEEWQISSEVYEVIEHFPLEAFDFRNPMVKWLSFQILKCPV
jgi:hypothetical protein